MIGCRISKIYLKNRRFYISNQFEEKKPFKELVKERNRIADLIAFEEKIMKEKSFSNSEKTSSIQAPVKHPQINENISKNNSLINKSNNHSQLKSFQVMKMAKRLKSLGNCTDEDDLLQIIDGIIDIDIMGPKLARMCLFANSKGYFNDKLLKISRSVLNSLLDKISIEKYVSPRDLVRLYLLRKIRPIPIQTDLKYFDVMEGILKGGLVDLDHVPKSFLLTFVRDVRIIYSKNYIALERATALVDALIEYCSKKKISLMHMECFVEIGSFLALTKLENMSPETYESLLKFFLSDKDLSKHVNEIEQLAKTLKKIGNTEYANELLEICKKSRNIVI